MKILIVRHGHPDYETDSLLPKGKREARLVAEYLKDVPIDDIYISPMGRAAETASYTTAIKGMTGVTLPWLREFEGRVIRPDLGEETICWDWLPADWTDEPAYYDKDKWCETDAMKQFDVKACNERVIKGIDELLASHGYERSGPLYKAVRPNNDTIALFCHFGVECVILGHMLNISPMQLWHGFCARTTSVTTVVSEERRPGIAYFRTIGFGETTHLYIGNEEPAFNARYCECYTNFDERHD